MKSPTSEVKCGERVFQMQSNIYAVNFTNNISRSAWTWQKLWNLLITNFKNKSFHNSVDWSGLYLGKCISLHNWKTIWDSRFLNDWKMHLWNSPSLGMIWLLIPYVEQLSLPLHKLSPLKKLKKKKKIMSPICHVKLSEKGPSMPYRRDTMPLVHWEIIWGYALPTYFGESGLKLVNGLNCQKRLSEKIGKKVEAFYKNWNVVM